MSTENKLVQEALDATAFVMNPQRTEGATIVDSKHLKTLHEAAQISQDAYNTVVELTEKVQRVKADTERQNRRTRRLMRTCFILLGLTGALIIFHLLQIFGVF